MRKMPRQGALYICKDIVADSNSVITIPEIWHV